MPPPLLPLPPEALRERVAGTPDAEWFDQSGARTLAEWQRALHAAGVDLAQAPVVMDFGCGCGRVVRHLKPHLSAHQRLIGADVDEEAIRWIALNYPNVDAVRLPVVAPSSIEAGSVDLIVSQSVFTHLPEAVQVGWLSDCARVLRPGGVFLTSVHGPKVVKDYCRHLAASNQVDAAWDLLSAYHGSGFYHVQGRTAAEMELPDYYGAAFHSIGYIEKVWLKSFLLIAYLPVASLGHQDIVVLRKA